jgi:dihydrofolate reductase
MRQGPTRGARVAELVYYVAASVDGFIATPDGGLDWLAPFEASGEDYGYAAFYDSIDAVLLGSRTFQQALTFGAWPYAGKPAWVFSKRVLPSPREDVTVTDRSPREVMCELEASGVRRAWLVGGGALAGSFRAAGLVTTYIVSVIPVILGSGVPMFGGSGPGERLRLVDTKTYPDGVVQSHFESPSAARHRSKDLGE